MKRAGVFVLLIAAAVCSPAADRSSWFQRVEPLMSGAERKSYTSLSPAERKGFEDAFWATRTISADEYYERAVYVDETFGSGKEGSGANTDRGRVYLSLGAPNRITRLASSRTFFPLEIWYYSGAPGLHLNYELQLLFFRPRGTGEYRLYSPTLNTIRDLLNPQTATRGLFGVNDVISEGQIRTQLTLSPAEDEVIPAAVSVARGITGSGNEEILALVASPERALTRNLKPSVTSRFIVSKPDLVVFETQGAAGAPQVDLALRVRAAKSVDMDVLEGSMTLVRQSTVLHFQAQQELLYEHRLDLLPGSYRVLFHVDGVPSMYPLEVKETAGLSRILLTEAGEDSRRNTPFEFDGRHLNPSGSGRVAVLQLARPGAVEWRLRRGAETVWREKQDYSEFAIKTVDTRGLAEGTYTLEARTEAGTERVVLTPGQTDKPAPVLSQNGNLSGGERLRFVAHQWLMRGKTEEAKRWLDRAQTIQPSTAVAVEMARIDALTGKMDDARAALQRVLRSDRRNFEALTTLAFVEAQLQDYRVAESLYREALEIQPSPVISQALAALPK